jgi:hypothetical protein
MLWYGNECWTLTRKLESALGVFEKKVLKDYMAKWKKTTQQHMED